MLYPAELLVQYLYSTTSISVDTLFDNDSSKYHHKIMKTKSTKKTNNTLGYIFVFVALLFGLTIASVFAKNQWKKASKQMVQKYSTEGTLVRDYVSPSVTLPTPRSYGGKGVYQAIQSRRSAREYAQKPLSLTQISQLLWSAQGITNKDTGARSAPSAKSSYPIEMYLVANNVSGLKQGVYHYSPADNTLSMLKLDFDQATFFKGANEQASVKSAPAVFVMTAVMGRTQAKFPDSPASTVAREVYQESGHVAQNMYLTVEDLGLGMVVVGGYNPELLPKTIGLSKLEEAVYLIPVGYKK